MCMLKGQHRSENDSLWLLGCILAHMYAKHACQKGGDTEVTQWQQTQGETEVIMVVCNLHWTCGHILTHVYTKFAHWKDNMGVKMPVCNCLDDSLALWHTICQPWKKQNLGENNGLWSMWITWVITLGQISLQCNKVEGATGPQVIVDLLVCKLVRSCVRLCHLLGRYCPLTTWL